VLAVAEPPSVPPRPAAPATPAPEEDAAPSLAGLRVLVVEDEKDSRAAIERILGQWGAVTASAAAVEEALALVERFEPQVLVSDIGMPGRDGYDLIRTLRQRGLSAQALPALALTAFARHDDERRALEAGFQAHLAKPADAGRLVHAVAQLAQCKVVE
jgi:CheY-like chemotaxis protein